MLLTRYVLTAIVALGLSASARAATPEQLSERALGDPKAPVTIVEYASMTCTSCAHFEREGLPHLKTDYVDKGKVRLIFRDYPLDQFAVKASMALRCVPPAQFFALKEHLFRTQEIWAFSKDPIAGLKQQAKLAGLSDSALDACFADKQLEDEILNSRLQGESKYKIQGTPTFILNDGAATVGSWDKLKAEIDKLLGMSSSAAEN
jgi:protein-disulfide isomerase